MQYTIYYAGQAIFDTVAASRRAAWAAYHARFGRHPTRYTPQLIAASDSAESKFFAKNRSLEIRSHA